MGKFTIGILCGLSLCAALKEAHKIGYNKGVEECTRMAKLANEVANTVENKKKGS